MANQQNRRLLALCSAAMLAVTGCAAVGSAKTVMAKGNSARTNTSTTTTDKSASSKTTSTAAKTNTSKMTTVASTTSATTKTSSKKATSATAKKTASKTTKKTAAVKKLKYKNGTYTGIGETRIGAVQVKITLKNDKITACNITGYSTHYSIGYIDPILPQELLARQNINKIDVVSGATLSTADFYYAVQQCLQEAKNA